MGAERRDYEERTCSFLALRLLRTCYGYGITWTTGMDWYESIREHGSAALRCNDNSVNDCISIQVELISSEASKETKVRKVVPAAPFLMGRRARLPAANLRRKSDVIDNCLHHSRHNIADCLAHPPCTVCTAEHNYFAGIYPFRQRPRARHYLAGLLLRVLLGLDLASNLGLLRYVLSRSEAFGPGEKRAVHLLARALRWRTRRCQCAKQAAARPLKWHHRASPE